jgi:hypothetical protein
VLLGNGDGTFGPKTDFGVGSSPVSVAIADLNADGRPDLAVANFFSSSLSVLLGHGNGTFGTRSDFPIGSTPQAMAIADVNADGRPDVAVANRDANTVSILLGNGDGTFGPMNDFGTGGPVLTVAIADLNADGQPDLVATSWQYSTVTVMLHTGGPLASVGHGPTLMDGSMAMAPNPTAGATQIHYSLIRAGRVRIELLDVSGRVEATITDRVQEPGRHVVTWDGVGGRGRVSPGLYFVRLVAPGRVTTRKLAVTR